MRTFKSLSEREILALAISLEEEDARIYADLADGLKEQHPAEAERFRALRADEDARQQAQVMEAETKQFYETAARHAENVSVRQLLGDLAEEERKHEEAAASLAVPEP